MTTTEPGVDPNAELRSVPWGTTVGDALALVTLSGDQLAAANLMLGTREQPAPPSSPPRYHGNDEPHLIAAQTAVEIAVAAVDRARESLHEALDIIAVPPVQHAAALETAKVNACDPGTVHTGYKGADAVRCTECFPAGGPRS
jgi:hypothetical protein